MRAVPRGITVATLILAVIGLGVSAYLTAEHYSANTTLSCPATTGIDCVKVTTSPESKVVGIPVALLGLLFFVGFIGLVTPWAWRSGQVAVHAARLAGVVVGMGFVLWLVYAELFRIDAICLWCTAVHLLTFALFVLIVFAAAGWGIRPDVEGDADPT
jgi:uncharacterized membrane protein